MKKFSAVFYLIFAMFVLISCDSGLKFENPNDPNNQSADTGESSGDDTSDSSSDNGSNIDCSNGDFKCRNDRVSLSCMDGKWLSKECDTDETCNTGTGKCETKDGNDKDSDNNSDNDQGRKQGELYGGCYPNKTCNDGLICDKDNNICIKDSESSENNDDSDNSSEQSDDDNDADTTPDSSDSAPDNDTDTDSGDSTPDNDTDTDSGDSTTDEDADTDSGDSTPDNDTDTDTTPADPCTPNPCLSVANSTKECSVFGSTNYKCECNSGYYWDGSQCDTTQTQTAACTGLKANAEWNTVSEIIQTSKPIFKRAESILA